MARVKDAATRAMVIAMAEKSSPEAAAFAIASLVLHPLTHISAIVNLFAWGKVFESKAFINWLSKGLSDKTFAKIDEWGNWIKRLAYTQIPGAQSGGQKALHAGEDWAQGVLEPAQ